MQKDIEEIRDALRDTYYQERLKYTDRIDRILTKRKEYAILWVEVDEFRSLSEIIKDLDEKGINIPTTTAWRIMNAMKKEGIIKKTGTKNKSPIYSKPLWAKELELGDYVKEKYDV